METSRTNLDPRTGRCPYSRLLMLGALAAAACGGPADYVLVVQDVRGVAVGDAVTANGVRVGHVTRVSTDSRAATVRFRLFDDTAPLRYADLVGIRKPIFSTRAEVRITRACIGDTAVVRRGTELRPASWAQESMIRVRCGADPAWRSVRDRLREFSESEAGQALSGWVDDAREYVESGEFADDAGEVVGELRDAGEALLRYFSERGEAGRADSVRTWLEKLRER